MTRALAVFLASASAAAAEGACAPDRIEIRTDDGVVSYAVEVADDEAERARGLMFRERMAPDAGMIFVYPTAQPLAFWMKNTPLPLDIVFISRRGVVCSIAEETTPFSEAAIPSGCAAQIALEVNAGQAAEQGIRRGAAVRHPAILDPVWACE